ncbi:hypothetical protein GCM10009647_085160 [Streptomyces sanglieri]|uniref:Uncharacterized protein n=1 Tax=Streptomyces sanglieri TaxID=193460 RepID=A0ABW2WNB7_9ACTN
MAQNSGQPLTDEQFDTLLVELSTHHKHSLEAITTGGIRPAPPWSATSSTDDDFSKLPDDAKKALADNLEDQVALLADDKKTIVGLLLQVHKKEITQEQLDEKLDVRKKEDIDAFTALENKLTEALKHQDMLTPSPRT